jgi:hypothetical protein
MECCAVDDCDGDSDGDGIETSPSFESSLILFVLASADRGKNTEEDGFLLSALELSFRNLGIVVRFCLFQKK